MEVIEKRLGRDYAWPGNVRELAQCIRRVMLKRDYEGQAVCGTGEGSALLRGFEDGTLSADELLNAYCRKVYQRLGTYEDTARVTGLDRRTVKRRVVGQ
jgi:transcriptional regulator of acetoin/glycerol metabolism